MPLAVANASSTRRSPTGSPSSGQDYDDVEVLRPDRRSAPHASLALALPCFEPSRWCIGHVVGASKKGSNSAEKKRCQMFDTQLVVRIIN